MTATLRATADAAARERLRIEAAAGRSRLGALVRRIPATVRYLGSEDAARSGLRYQPVAWTAIALTAVAFWFPGRSESSSGGAATLAQPPLSFVTPTTTATTPAIAPPTTVPPPVATFGPAPVTVARPAVQAGSATTPITTTSTSLPPAAIVPLSVRGFGWASLLSGSGISSAGVPEGAMPVATRLGRVDKASFVRLAGTARTLTLVEDADGARETLGTGLVVACPITEPAWQEGPDQSFDDAPAWSTDACVPGTEGDDGTWTFDLSVFADRTGDAGFALVPDAAAPADFQVTFRSA